MAESKNDKNNEIIQKLKNGAFLLFHSIEMASIAESIVNDSQGSIIKGNINWERFPDNFPNVFIEEALILKHAHVVFLASLHDPSVILEQYAVMSTFPRLLCKSFRVIVPWFPTGTMERENNLGEVATAKTLARILSTIPHCRKGPAQIFIFDIHALPNLFYFDDNVIVRLHSMVGELILRLKSEPNQENITIAFPDEGASKRYSYKFSNIYPIAVCSKVRNADKRIVVLKEGNVVGKKVVIVDDLVQSGGTLLECQKTLLANKATTVECYVTHAIFPKDSWKKFTNCGLNRFYITDSNPLMAKQLAGIKPFEVISIDKRVSRFIMEGD